MRTMFGALSLLIVVAIVGLLAKKQLGAVSAVSPVPAPAVASGSSMAVPTGIPQQQVEQFKQAIDAATQQARPMPDEIK